jgi:hypothetical protein
MVKPNGMGGITDWWPPAIHDSETSEYNASVLLALTNYWVYMMSLSYYELDHIQRDLQVGDLNAQIRPNGYVTCPFCQKTFLASSQSSWDGARHLTCGVRLKLVPEVINPN